MQYVLLIGMLALFMVATIIPQRRRQKQMQQMQDSLGVGSRVRTAGGFIGTIIAMRPTTFIIECGPENTQLEILKGAVAVLEDMEVAEEEAEEAMEESPIETTEEITTIEDSETVIEEQKSEE
ncbi:MAG: preprotein translocase subunit YajC [Christensenellaceae bacterium]|jgi:preprotein translocase subunit YajC